MASLQNNVTVNTPTTGLQTMPAKSSFISAFEFDSVNLRLTVHFKSGAIYQYSFYLAVAWEQLKQSQNHSKHYADNIKGKFGGTRIKNANHPRIPKLRKPKLPKKVGEK